ncbi:MAG: hypothetical protein ACKN9K_32595, partial [Dolichospermum sp.]
LKVEVDDSPLYSLNKHLDLKYKHFKEVNRYFKNNPITPTVNTEKTKSDLLGISKLKPRPLELTANKQIITQQIKQAVDAGGRITTTVTVKNKSSDEQGNSKEIVTSLKAVENAIRSQKPNPVVSVSDEQGNSKEIVT